MKKISITVPPNKESFVIYFADEVIDSLYKLAPPNQQENFLNDIALALLSRCEAKTPNQFYVRRIEQIEEANNQEFSLLFADYANKKVKSDYKVALKEKITTPDITTAKEEAEKKELLKDSVWNELHEELDGYEKLEKFSVTVNVIASPYYQYKKNFVIYFAEDVLSLMVPMVPLGQEKAFLNEIALAILHKRNDSPSGSFYVRKIFVANNPDRSATHSVLIFNRDDLSFTNGLLLNINNKVTSCVVSFPEVILKRELTADIQWKKFIKTLDGYDQSAKDRALKAFKDADFVLPSALPEPKESLTNPIFNVQDASKLFNIAKEKNHDIECALEQRRRRIENSKKGVTTSREKLNALREKHKQAFNEYDVKPLIEFIDNAIGHSAIEDDYLEATTKIGLESQRVDQHPSQSALTTLFDPSFHYGKIDKQPLLQTISDSFIKHEAHMALLLKIKQVLEWAIREAARHYFATIGKDLSNAGVVRAELYGKLSFSAWTSNAPLTEKERTEYLEKKRKNFNEKFACVGIQISPIGQLILNKPELFLDSDLATLQEIVRTLLKNCNTSLAGQSSAHSIVDNYLKQFDGIIKKVIFSLASSKTLIWLNINYDELKSAEIFLYQDVTYSKNPLSGNNIRVLQNLGGNVLFTWSKQLFEHEQVVKEHCSRIVESIVGNQSDITTPGLIQFLVDDIITNETGRQTLREADAKIDAANGKIAQLEKDIVQHIEILKLQKRLSLPVNLSSGMINGEMAKNLEKFTTPVIVARFSSDAQTLLEQNVSQLQTLAKQAAESAKITLTELIGVKERITAKTLEAASLDIIEMNEFKKKIEADNAKVLLYKNAFEATQTLLKTRAEEEEKIQAHAEACRKMLATHNPTSTPAEVFALSESIKYEKKEFERALQFAITHESALAEALAKNPVDLEMVKRTTTDINEISAELKQIQQRLAKAVATAAKESSAEHKMHQNHIELLELIIPIVKNLKFWAQQVKSGGKTIKGDDNKDYTVPEGIAALVTIIKQPQYQDFKDIPLTAESFYVALRTSTNSSNSKGPGLFGSNPRLESTDGFYRAVSTAENDKKVAIETWKRVYYHPEKAQTLTLPRKAS